MVVINSFYKIILSLSVGVIFLGQAFAQKLEKGQSKLKFLFNALYQNGEDGRQIYDNSKREEVSVIEPMLFLEHQITEKTNIKAKILFDAWSAASDTKLDAGTGASGGAPRKWQSRVASSFFLNHEHSKSINYGGNLGFSTEYDYKSFNGGFNFAQSLAQDNFTYAISTQVYFDKNQDFDLIKEVMTEEQDKKVYALSVSASQLLTRFSVIQFGVSLISIDGSMENISNSVSVNGVRVSEVLPDSRMRQAYTVNYGHAFNEMNAIHTQYRYYTDDWGVRAHTLKTSFRRSADDDESLWEFSYRIHSQSQVDYYRKSFTKVETNMTSDSDMSKFIAHQFGIFYSKQLGDKAYKYLSLEEMEVTIGAYHYFRDNNLNAEIVQVAFGTTF